VNELGTWFLRVSGSSDNGHISGFHYVMKGPHLRFLLIF
jgi:hypothetical protein